MQDVQNLLEALGRSPRILSDFARTVPKECLDVRRGAGFWTIAEHISHLAQVQPMLLERFERFMKEEHPFFVPYIPGKADDEPKTPPLMSIPSAIEQFSGIREKQVALLGRADAATWKKTATHPEYEAYSFIILTRHVLLHDYWHMYRMEELWLTRDAYLTKYV